MKNKKMKLLLKYMKVFSSFCSFNYYLFDNIVWLSQIGIFNKFIISNFKWKKLKDIFSLWKTMVEVVISIYVVRLKLRKEHELKERLNKYLNSKVVPDSHVHALVRKLIVTRRKTKFHLIEVFIYAMRMIMLISSLKLVGHKYLDPIFVSICGLLQAISVVFKSMKGKKKFYKVTIKDVKDEFGIKQEKTVIFS
jgi:hypothetical protein